MRMCCNRDGKSRLYCYASQVTNPLEQPDKAAPPQKGEEDLHNLCVLAVT